jgi:hypothetical protein
LSHRFKFVGLLISLVAIAILVLQKITGVFFIQSFPENQQSQLLILLISVGLYITAFSRESIDDHRIRQIRNKSVQAGFILILSTMIAFSFVSILRQLPSSQSSFPLILLIGILFYLIIFNFRVYFKAQ